MHSSYAILLFCAKNHEGRPGREGLEQGGVCHNGQTEAGISLQKQIKEQSILINGKAAKAGNKLNIKDKVQVTLEPPKELQIEAENIPLDILYEDEDIIVINKPKQMVVHPDITLARL